jgi:hypothetical protein
VTDLCNSSATRHSRKMLTLKECKSILNKVDDTYSDEEVVLIRDYLIELGKINVSIIEKLKKHDHEASSNNVPSEFRRTG